MRSVARRDVDERLREQAVAIRVLAHAHRLRANHEVVDSWLLAMPTSFGTAHRSPVLSSVAVCRFKVRSVRVATIFDTCRSPPHPPLLLASRALFTHNACQILM